HSANYPDSCVSGEQILEEIENSTKKSKYCWQTDILGQFLPCVVAEMQRRKQRDGLYAYSDMLKLVAQSLRRAERGDPASRAFADTVRATYKYALIDEFQDTDPTQWEIFRRLFVDASALDEIDEKNHIHHARR